MTLGCLLDLFLGSRRNRLLTRRNLHFHLSRKLIKLVSDNGPPTESQLHVLGPSVDTDVALQKINISNGYAVFQSFVIIAIDGCIGNHCSGNFISFIKKDQQSSSSGLNGVDTSVESVHHL